MSARSLLRCFVPSALLLACTSRVDEEGAPPVADAPTPSVAREVVVLVHGMGRSGASMSPLGDRLAAEGFDAVRFDYDSLGAEPEDSAASLRARLAELDGDESVGAIHVVGHSLGGILARMALTDERPARLGRLVMLAPPNGGSGWSRILGPALSRWIAPLDDLSDEEGSPVRSIPPPEGYELGVIAARYDGKVSLGSSHVEGETDHLVVNGVHSFLMRQEEVQRQVARFLREGRFERD